MKEGRRWKREKSDKSRSKVPTLRGSLATNTNTTKLVIPVHIQTRPIHPPNFTVLRELFKKNLPSTCSEHQQKDKIGISQV